MNLQEQSIWVAKTLFDKGLISGTTGNISYRIDDIIYVSESGTCFGLIDQNSFAKISMDGQILEGKPSKEWPMHLKLYQINSNILSVIHTHSFYSTLFSCQEFIDIQELFKYTPYLKMQTNGKINIIEYGKPGSKELFDKFSSSVKLDVNNYILKNHGIFVAAQNPLKAFGIVEEFEQSTRIAISSKKQLTLSKIID